MTADRQPSMFDDGAYPARLYDGTPPHERAATSHAAAVAILPSQGTLRRRVFELICAAEPRGLTDEQGIAISGMAANTWRPRRVELVQLGLIRHEGERRTSSGRMAQIWRACVVSANGDRRAATRRQIITHEAVQLVHKDPNVILGFEAGVRVLAVGRFADDDIDISCVHRADDVIGAAACARALRKIERDERGHT